ncbi:MAG: Uma2 family endonuclease [Chloroflexota bacterium]
MLDAYVEHKQLGYVGQETVLVALTRNDYLPDICFFGKEKATLLVEDQMKFPPSDFVVEVLSPSTADKDRGEKMLDYATHGVQEYWLVDPEAQVVEQYGLVLGEGREENGRFALLLKLKTGTLTSHVINGFTIPVEAIFDKSIKN